MKCGLLLVFVCFLSACSSVWSRIPPAPIPIPVLKPPTIALKCKGDNATIQLSSATPIFTPLLEVPRFSNGTVPIRYQFEDFTGPSETLELTWCPVSAALEYSRVAGGERFKTGGTP